MHYFLSQHPLSSRGKSIPKVKGHPRSIPFVPSPMPYMFNMKSVLLSAAESKQALLSSATFLASLIFLLSFRSKSSTKDCLLGLVGAGHFRERKPSSYATV